MLFAPLCLTLIGSVNLRQYCGGLSDRIKPCSPNSQRKILLRRSAFSSKRNPGNGITYKKRLQLIVNAVRKLWRWSNIKRYIQWGLNHLLGINIKLPQLLLMQIWNQWPSLIDKLYFPKIFDFLITLNNGTFNYIFINYPVVIDLQSEKAGRKSEVVWGT